MNDVLNENGLQRGIENGNQERKEVLMDGLVVCVNDGLSSDERNKNDDDWGGSNNNKNENENEKN